MSRIKKAWGEYFDQVEVRLDREGWYDGSNDLVQKEFPNIEITKARFYQRPTELGGVVKQKTEPQVETIVEPQGEELQKEAVVKVIAVEPKKSLKK